GMDIVYGWKKVEIAICFFFQAEDGIRDKLVTGVQTCALPICLDRNHAGGNRNDLGGSVHALDVAARCVRHEDQRSKRQALGSNRSEERRVGKEWRSRRATAHLRKK